MRAFLHAGSLLHFSWPLFPVAVLLASRPMRRLRVTERGASNETLL
jgi:hypothetical protein